MARYVGVRFVQGLVVLFLVVTVVFRLGRVSGNIAEIIAPPEASAEAVAEIERSLGLDRPLIVQYGSYLSDLAQGNLGESYSYRRPVSELIRDSLPNTIQLGVVAFIFAVVVGVSLGVASGMHPDGVADRLGKGIALLGQSVPSFWLGILLVAAFAVRWQWFPAYGKGGWQNVVLPAVALGWYPLASLTRLTRSAVIEVRQQDHTLFTRAKGVAPRRMMLHTVRNASLPVVTLAGIQLGAMLSATVVVETLFAWPGMGQLAIHAINARDYNVVQGVVLVNTLLFGVLLFLVDLSYGVIDPRVRSVHTGSGGDNGA
ncbi:MAG: ABC transporter permease [Acidimicrobiales bacterium]